MTRLPRARFKSTPEDFLVEEIPAYEPEGQGSHLYVRFTKRDLTTDQAVRALAAGAGVAVRDVGVAGLKDKVGVTTQTVSLPVPPVSSAVSVAGASGARGARGASEDFDARVLALSIPGVTIHEARRHGNKLKTGHLHGNRFTVILRGIAGGEVAHVIASLERAGREGIPNAFGAQRFGRERDNAAHALAWLTGKTKGPPDPRKKRFLWSALQSELFNAVLDRRVEGGTWRTPLAGDILKKTDTGGLFPCTDEAEDRARAERGEVSPTGPMFGVKMRAPTGLPGELERQVFDERLGKDFDLARTRPFGEGTRRGLCLAIEGMTVQRLREERVPDERLAEERLAEERTTVEQAVNRQERSVSQPVDETGSNSDESREQEGALMVRFVLPKGAYATSVLGAAVAVEPERSTAASDEPEPSEAAGEFKAGRDERGVREGDRSRERPETELE